MTNGNWSAKDKQLWEGIQTLRGRRQKRHDLSPHQLRRLMLKRKKSANS